MRKMSKKNDSYYGTTIQYENIDFDVEYDYQPSEPMVMYYADGSGYPGCGADVQINSLKIGDFEVYDVILEHVIESIIELIIEEHEG